VKTQPIVVCPVDFSEASLDGLDVALALSERIGGRILLLHVLDGGPSAVDASHDDAGERGEPADAALSRIADGSIPDYVPSRVQVARGEPAEEIARIADAECATAIVMAARGESGWDGAGIGSVTREVVSRAGRPVMIVPRSDSPGRKQGDSFVRTRGEKTAGSEL
jgi:nucleotide-binding universal stress UspA family protein